MFISSEDSFDKHLYFRHQKGTFLLLLVLAAICAQQKYEELDITEKSEAGVGGLVLEKNLAAFSYF